MPNYQYDVSISRQKRFIRRFKRFLLVLLGVGLIAGGIIWADSFQQNIKSDTGIGKPVTTTVSPSVREFDTPYFTFASPTSWKNAPTLSTARKFVYLDGKSDVSQQELTIYVDELPKDISGTQALPVRISEIGNRLVPTEVTDHCNTASTVKKASLPVQVTISGVTMQCQLDGANYTVIVGEKGGSPALKMKRNDGTTGTYYFVYRSSSVPPDTQPLIDIISSFTSL